MIKSRVLTLLCLFLSFSLNSYCSNLLKNENIRPRILTKNGFSKISKAAFNNKQIFEKENKSKYLNKKPDNKTKSKILKKENIKSNLIQNSYPRGWEPKENGKLE